MIEARKFVFPKALEELFSEIEAADPEAFQPGKAEKGDGKVLGEVGPYARKIYAVFRFYKLETDLAAARYQNSTSEDDDEELHAGVHELDWKKDLLYEMLWYLIRAEIEGGGRCRKRSMGIRKGWKIVEAKDDPQEPPEIFKRLFGIG